jgi:hypothetical protein
MPGRWKPWNTLWNTNHSLPNPACGDIAARFIAAMIAAGLGGQPGR